jgi:hypothetical protein
MLLKHILMLFLRLSTFIIIPIVSLDRPLLLPVFIIVVFVGVYLLEIILIFYEFLTSICETFRLLSLSISGLLLFLLMCRFTLISLEIIHTKLLSVFVKWQVIRRRSLIRYFSFEILMLNLSFIRLGTPLVLWSFCRNLHFNHLIKSTFKTTGSLLLLEFGKSWDTPIDLSIQIVAISNTDPSSCFVTDGGLLAWDDNWL